MKENTFQMQCLNLLLKIPKGKVTTYQELAHALETRAYRAVGTAMAKNEFLGTYPCYKVIKTNGEVGEYAGQQPKKIELLEKDGIIIKNKKVQNLNEVLFRSEDFLK
jgi:methylated-DNA-[protein]-cysteine S-methyltransferase